MSSSKLEFHPVSELFPLMEGSEFEELKADISANGLRDLIWEHKESGAIIDGRNRARALKELGMELRCQVWPGEDDELLAFVISKNLKRRQLTASQRAMTAVAIEEYIAIEIARKERKRKILPSQPKPPSVNDCGKIATVEKPVKAREEAAKMVDASPRYVSDAKKVYKASPEVAAEVKAGNKSLPAAKRELGFTPKPKYKPPVSTAANGAPASQQDALVAKLTAEGKDFTVTKGEKVGKEIEPEKPKQTDEEWLATLPLHSKLEGRSLRRFCGDALFWRATKTARDTWGRAVAEFANKTGRHHGSFLYHIRRGLKIGGPSNWKVCPSVKDGGCAGAGTLELVGDCPKCHGDGFILGG